VVISNRTPDEWLTMMADPLLAQSAVDRLVSTAHELVIEGPSDRQRQNHQSAGTPSAAQRGSVVPIPRGTPACAWSHVMHDGSASQMCDVL
jgi:hypothetical protein